MTWSRVVGYLAANRGAAYKDLVVVAPEAGGAVAQLVAGRSSGNRRSPVPSDTTPTTLTFLHTLNWAGVRGVRKELMCDIILERNLFHLLSDITIMAR